MSNSAKNRFRPSFDRLEDRNLMAVNASLVGSVIRIEGTESADNIVVKNVGSNIQVLNSGSVVASFASSKVDSVVVRSLGGNDTIDLTAVNRSAIVWSGAGNDTIHGTGQGDYLDGGEGDDTLYGYNGNDNLGANRHFESKLMETGTPLHETGNTFQFEMADWNRDGYQDLFVIKKSGTGTKTTEVHILSGKTNFSTWLAQSGTGLHETNSNWEFEVADWNADGKPDVIAFAKAGTGTKSTEVHVLNGKDNFKTFLLQTGTALHETNSNWEFEVANWNADGYLDVIAFGKSGGGTWGTEVHILNGKNLSSWLLHTGTGLHETGASFDLDVADANRDGTLDLIAIKKSGTGTKSTEVHVLSGLVTKGEAGNDQLYGGNGDDILSGGAGDDALFGGAGKNQLIGGQDDDRFLRWSANDVVAKGEVKSNDAEIWFKDTTSPIEGKKLRGFEGTYNFSVAAWSDAEILAADVALGNLVARTNNTRLLKNPDGTGMSLRRVGDQTFGISSVGGWNSGNEIVFVGKTIIGATSTSFDTLEFYRTIFHEFGHNWDSYEGPTQQFATKFRNHSGWLESDSDPSTSKVTYTPSRGVEDKWYFTGNVNNFARTYGTNSPNEDYSTTWEAYFLQEYHATTNGLNLIGNKVTEINKLFEYLKS